MGIRISRNYKYNSRGDKKFYTETRGDTSTQGTLVHNNHGNITVSEI